MIRCQLRAPGTEELRGQLVCKPAQALQMASVAQDVRVPPGQTVEETFTLELPWHTAPGEYPLSLILTDGTSPCAGAGVTLLVEPAVEITAVTPAVVAGGYGANVTLQAPHARRAEGELTVAPSAAGLAEQHGRFSLSAGAAATHTFGWTTDGAPPYGLQADLKAVTADGVTASSTCDFDFLPAAWMPRSPVIDGHLNDWGTTTAVAVEPKRMGDGADSEIDPADFSSRVRVGWNQHALFVACEVTDDQHCQGASQLNFLSDEDSLLLAVNLDPLHATVAGGERVEGGVLRRWQELVFALSETDPKGARAGRVGSYDLRFAPCGDLEQKGVSQAIVRDGTTTTYEIALPWELLGDQNFPDTGDAVGFALLVRDLDVVAGDRRSQIAPLFGGVLPPRDVSRYGWVLLMQS